MAKGMPTQGAKAIIRSWGDANEMILKNGSRNKKKKAARKGNKA